MGTGASSSNKDTLRNADQSTTDSSARPSSSPVAASRSRSDIPEAKLLRRPNSSTSKVAPVDSGYSDQNELDRWKEIAATAERKAQDLEQQLVNFKSSAAGLEKTNADSVKLTSKAGQLPPVNAQTQLQRELDEAKTRIKKLTSQYKRKLRQFNTQLAECKQERALEMFDHKTIIDKLQQENSALTVEIERLRQAEAKRGTVEADVIDSVSAAPVDNRTTLILNLSSRVSEQEAEIRQLQQQLRDHGSTQHSDAATAAAAAADDGDDDVDSGPSWHQRCTVSSLRSSVPQNCATDTDATAISNEWRPMSLLNGGRNFSTGYQLHWQSADFTDDLATDEHTIQNGPAAAAAAGKEDLSSDSQSPTVDSEMSANLRQVSAPRDRRRQNRPAVDGLTGNSLPVGRPTVVLSDGKPPIHT